jgi:hypothetical protein
VLYFSNTRNNEVLLLCNPLPIPLKQKQHPTSMPYFLEVHCPGMIVTYHVFYRLPGKPQKCSLRQLQAIDESLLSRAPELVQLSVTPIDTRTARQQIKVELLLAQLLVPMTNRLYCASLQPLFLDRICRKNCSVRQPRNRRFYRPATRFQEFQTRKPFSLNSTVPRICSSKSSNKVRSLTASSMLQRPSRANISTILIQKHPETRTTQSKSPASECFTRDAFPSPQLLQRRPEERARKYEQVKNPQRSSRPRFPSLP